MDEFPKQVYRKSEYQNQRPKEPTPEREVYSEKVAREKLVRVMDPEYKDFAIRYVNLEVYREMLETQILHKQDKQEVKQVILWEGKSLKEVLEKDRLDDSWTMNQLTDWGPESTRSRGKERGISLSIDDEREDKEEREKREGRRHERLKAELMRRVSLRGEFLDEWKAQSADEQKETEERVGKENLELLQKARDNPEYVNERGAMRKIYNALVYVEDDTKPERDSESFSRSEFLMAQTRQYQIALIFDTKVVRTFGPDESPLFQGMAGTYWQLISTDFSDPKRQRGLVAAVSLIHLKDLSREMVALERGSGDLAHPILSVLGRPQDRGRIVVRWPK